MSGREWSRRRKLAVLAIAAVGAWLLLAVAGYALARIVIGLAP